MHRDPTFPTLVRPRTVVLPYRADEAGDGRPRRPEPRCPLQAPPEACRGLSVSRRRRDYHSRESEPSNSGARRRRGEAAVQAERAPW